MMENVYGKKIRISDLEESHWTFFSDILWNVKKSLGGYPYPESLIYAIIDIDQVDQKNSSVTFLPYNEKDRDDSRLRFVEPGFELEVLKIIKNY